MTQPQDISLSDPIYFNGQGIGNPLGADWQTVADRLMRGDPAGLEGRYLLTDGRSVPVGRLSFELPPLPDALGDWDSRNNRLVFHCLTQLRNAVETAKARYGPAGIGIVIGTSTSGIDVSERAVAQHQMTGVWPDGYRFHRQELGDPALFAAEVLGVSGPCFGVSTACTSGAKALASAARLIRTGLCDAVIAGGVDTLCGLTLNGFSVLDAITEERCNPFSRNRCGINIGEGGALFLLSREDGPLRLAGWGEGADAYHMSAPDPEGGGGKRAIEAALAGAGIIPADISYVNLHGTATVLNDAMEAKLTHAIFGSDCACSSTKGLTGHMLGAAGSNEAAFVAMALQRAEAPPHVWDGESDPDLPELRLTGRPGTQIDGRYMMSCSYAFGGNSMALILARE